MVAACPYRFVRFPSCGIFKPTRTIPVAKKFQFILSLGTMVPVFKDFQDRFVFLGLCCFFFLSPFAKKIPHDTRHLPRKSHPVGKTTIKSTSMPS